MKRHRIEFSPEAIGHLERAQAWWIANRPGAATVFRRELTVAIRQLSRAPLAAPLYTEGSVPGTRRMLMPRTRLHVYFVIDEGSNLVRVYAVWHASRESGPR